MKHGRIIAALAASAFLVGTVGIYGGSILADDLSDAQKEKQRLEERRAEAEEELASLETEKGSLLDSVEKLDTQMEDVNGQLEKVNADLETAQGEYEQLTVDLQLAEMTEQNQYDTMKKRIKYMYENGSEGYLDIIFASKSVGEFLNRLEYVNKITAYDNKMLKEYEKTKQEVADKKAESEDKLAQLSVLQEEVELEQTNLETLLKKKQKKIEEYNDFIKDKTAESEEYAKEIEEKEAEIETLLLKQAQNSNFNAECEESGFIWPLSVKGTITSHFGKRSAPTAGASTYHKGIDVAAPQGTSILAVADGTVTTATYSSSAGNYVMIKHSNGLYSVYMHSSKLYCKVGDKVSQGDKIAAVGSTGVSTGPHLHFGVIANGTYVDPELYLPKH